MVNAAMARVLRGVFSTVYKTSRETRQSERRARQTSLLDSLVIPQPSKRVWVAQRETERKEKQNKKNIVEWHLKLFFSFCLCSSPSCLLLLMPLHTLFIYSGSPRTMLKIIISTWQIVSSQMHLSSHVVWFFHFFLKFTKNVFNKKEFILYNFIPYTQCPSSSLFNYNLSQLLL